MLDSKKWIVVREKGEDILYSKKKNRQGLHFRAKTDTFGKYIRMGFVTDEQYKKIKKMAK